MDYKIALEKFEGPLDLLLKLIESREMNISQIALAEVTDGYLAYLDSHQDINATELADFLVVATKLLVIKSKTLLPLLADDEEDSAEQLEAQLKMYKDYLDASKNLEKIIAANNFLFSRDRVAVNFEVTFSPPKLLKADELSSVYAEILNRIDYIVNLPQRALEQTVSLKEKVTNIRDIIFKLQKINFSEILVNAKNRTEMVVSFMALLELIKSGEVAVNQVGVFDEIYIEKA